MNLGAATLLKSSFAGAKAPGAEYIRSLREAAALVERGGQHWTDGGGIGGEDGHSAGWSRFSPRRILSQFRWTLLDRVFRLPHRQGAYIAVSLQFVRLRSSN